MPSQIRQIFIFSVVVTLLLLPVWGQLVYANEDTSDNWIFFQVYTGNHEADIYKNAVGRKLPPIKVTHTNNVIGDIYHIDGWLYYVSLQKTDLVGGQAKGYIYKIKTDGTNLQKIYDSAVISMDISDGLIYAATAKYNGIHILNLDGKKINRLDINTHTEIKVDRNWIYFTENGLFKVKLDGTEKTRLSEEEELFYSYSYFHLFGEWLEYRSSEPNNHVLMKVDGSVKRNMNGFYGRIFTVADNQICYDKRDPKNKDLYKMDIETGKEIVVAPSTGDSVIKVDTTTNLITYRTSEGYFYTKDLYKVTKLTVNKTRITLQPNMSTQMILKAVLSDGTNRDVTELAEWSSTDTKIVEVSNGKIKGVSKGKATIKAKYKGKIKTISVTVK